MELFTFRSSNSLQVHSKSIHGCWFCLKYNNNNNFYLYTSYLYIMKWKTLDLVFWTWFWTWAYEKLMVHLSTLDFFMEMRFDVPGDRTLESTVRALAGWSFLSVDTGHQGSGATPDVWGAHLGRENTTPDLRASSLSQAASLKMSVKVLRVIVIRSVTPEVVALKNRFWIH